MALHGAWPTGTRARKRGPAHAKTAFGAIGIAAIWWLLSSIPSAMAQAGEAPAAAVSRVEPAAGADVTGSGEAAFSEARRPEVGMSLQEALALVGDAPDSQEEVGAACGMLDVLTWDEEGTKIISVDGTVTSIVEGRKKQP
jgi:hypothetical protein